MIALRTSCLALCVSMLATVPASAQVPKAQAKTGLRWHNLLELGLEGRGWSDTKHPYDRLPARAEKMVRPAVWSLSRNSTGLGVRFVTDAPSIAVRWTLRSDRLDLPHMPATGVSGVDLYVRHEGRWQFVANGRPTQQTNEVTLVQDLALGEAEYRLYLPLYNGVDRVEIGVPEGASIRPGPAPEARPVVVYGTSITQGGCASRPGMCYTSILERRLDAPVINLGFSGNGKAEPELAALLAELRPAAFVLDCLPNLSVEEVAERMPGFVATLRETHPDVPILLVENITYTNAPFSEARTGKVRGANAHLRRLFDDRVAAGDRALTYVPGGDLIGHDGEGTVDSTHPTDLGFLRMADAIEPYLRKALAAGAGR